MSSKLASPALQSNSWQSAPPTLQQYACCVGVHARFHSAAFATQSNLGTGSLMGQPTWLFSQQYIDFSVLHMSLAPSWQLNLSHALFWSTQHSAFFLSDQPVSQRSKPASQSKPKVVVDKHPRFVLSQQNAALAVSHCSGAPNSQSKASQPRPAVSQQYSFLPADQPVSHIAKPSLQSKRNSVVDEMLTVVERWHPIERSSQHQTCFA
mmetsp:Transcript_120115/g.347018  ORF Transcript_120115/g.347018 Transcript_120115/m.347018 type:complete len:208 (+) Transcript_120115:3050-3673(+)